MEIIAQAPTRLSLFGGGTDIPSYASTYGGVCLNIAINIRQRVWIEDKKDGVNLIEGANPAFYTKIFEEFGLKDVSIKQEFDGKIESGLGSSAAAAVSIIGAVNKIKGLNLTRDQIAEKAWDLEVNKIGLYGGKQDQYASVYGGVNFMEFISGKVNVTQLNMEFISKLFPYLILFYVGENRKNPKIQEGFKELKPTQVLDLNMIKETCLASLQPISDGDIPEVSRLFNLAWELKKTSNSGVTNDRIDLVYKTGMKLASAGKICGAGGGGHMLFICSPGKQEELKKKMEEITSPWVDFSIDWNGLDTRIL